MASLGASGVWELFIPGLDAGALYKFELRNRNTARSSPRPIPMRSASSCGRPRQRWWWSPRRMLEGWRVDGAARPARLLHAPMSVYELHLGSCGAMRRALLQLRRAGTGTRTYVSEMGFTHIELMPVTEHPLDDRGATRPRLLAATAAMARRTICATSSTPAIRQVSASSSTGCPATFRRTIGRSATSTARPCMNTPTATRDAPDWAPMYSTTAGER